MSRVNAKKKTAKTKTTKTNNETPSIATVVDNIAQAKDASDLPTAAEVYGLLCVVDSATELSELVADLSSWRNELVTNLNVIQDLVARLKERVSDRPESSLLANSWASLVDCADFLEKGQSVCVAEQPVRAVMSMPYIVDDEGDASATPCAKLLPGLNDSIIAHASTELKDVYTRLLSEAALTLLRAAAKSSVELIDSCNIIGSLSDALSGVDRRIAALNKMFYNERGSDGREDAE